MNEVYDVAVIGAGVIGAATAYYNARRGAKVIVIDTGDMAQGTSSKCDGNLYCTGSMPGYGSALKHLSQILTAQLSTELEYDFEWGQRGSLAVAENEFEWEILKKQYRGFKNVGIPVSLLDAKELRDEEPGLAKDLYGGVLTHTSGCVYPMGYTYAMCLGVERLGGKLQLHTEVTGIIPSTEEQSFTIQTTQGNFVAANVVNCAGVWANRIGQMVGIDIPIKPRHGLILVSEQSIKPAKRKVWECGYMSAQFEGAEEFRNKRTITPEMEKYGVAFVYEPTGNDNFLLGSSRMFAGYDTNCRAEIMKLIAQRAIRFMPGIKDTLVIRSYSGVRPYVEDHKPIVSPTDIPGFYIAAGHEGDGICMSAVTGYMIAQMIQGEPTLMDCEPLSLNRFKTGKAAKHDNIPNI